MFGDSRDKKRRMVTVMVKEESLEGVVEEKHLRQLRCSSETTSSPVRKKSGMSRHLHVLPAPL
jgi:hypothetical protein